MSVLFYYLDIAHCILLAFYFWPFKSVFSLLTALVNPAAITLWGHGGLALIYIPTSFESLPILRDYVFPS